MRSVAAWRYSGTPLPIRLATIESEMNPKQAARLAQWSGTLAPVAGLQVPPTRVPIS